MSETLLLRPSRIHDVKIIVGSSREKRQQTRQAQAPGFPTNQQAIQLNFGFRKHVALSN